MGNFHVVSYLNCSYFVIDIIAHSFFLEIFHFFSSSIVIML